MCGDAGKDRPATRPCTAREEPICEVLLLLRMPPHIDHSQTSSRSRWGSLGCAFAQSDCIDAFIECCNSQKEQKATGLNPAAAVANGLLAASLFFTPVLNVVHSDTFSAGGDANAQVFWGGHASTDCAVHCLMANIR